MTLVEDGALLHDNLHKAGRDPDWVRKALRDRGAGISDTLLLTVDDSGHIVFLRKGEGR